MLEGKFNFFLASEAHSLAQLPIEPEISQLYHFVDFRAELESMSAQTYHGQIDFGYKNASDQMISAISTTLSEPSLRTKDLGGNADTITTGKAIEERLK